MQIVQQLSITQRLISLLGIAALGTALMVAFMMFLLNNLLVKAVAIGVDHKRATVPGKDSANCVVCHSS